MPRPYSQDLCVRLIGAVEAGASARLAARLFGVSASTAVKWVARRRRTGSVAAPPMGGSFRSPVDDHEAWILALVNEQPDLTLAAVRGRLRQQGVQAAIGTIRRFFERHGISPYCGENSEPGRYSMESLTSNPAFSTAWVICGRYGIYSVDRDDCSPGRTLSHFNDPENCVL